MEPLYPWLMLIAGLLVGALVGGAVMMTMERRSRGSENDVRVVRRELEDYRNEVAEHYAETAKRVNGLTHAYKDVYDHLERGAYRLVGEPELRRRLDDAEPRPVTLEGIGGRGLQRPREETHAEGTGSPVGEAAEREGADERPEDSAVTGTSTVGTGTATRRPPGTGSGDARAAAATTASGAASRTTDASRSPEGERAADPDVQEGTGRRELDGRSRAERGTGSSTAATDGGHTSGTSARDGTAYRHALGAEDERAADEDSSTRPRTDAEVDERSDETERKT